MSYQTKIMLPFLGMLALSVAVTVAVTRMAEAEQSTPVQLGDLSSATIVEIRTASGAPVLTGEFQRIAEADGEVQLEAILQGAGSQADAGEVEIEIPPAGAADQRQEFEVEVKNLQPQTAYAVFVNDRQVITFTTDARGRADVEVKASR